MRFLLRVAFWLSVIIMLLPSPPSQRAGQPQISAGEAMSAASAAMSDLRQFCARQPDACAVGSQALNQFGVKAEAGAKMLYEFLNDRFDAQHGAADRRGVIATGAVKPSQNTLTPADLAVPWRGPAPRPDARRPV